MRWLSILVIMILWNAYTPCCEAQVEKSSLAAKVETEIGATLMQEQARSVSDKPVPSDVLTSRAKRIAATISHINMENVDDGLAQWIVQSLVAVVRNDASVLITNTPHAETVMTSTVNQAEYRFSTLDNAKGRTLMAQRDKILRDSRDYTRTVQAFLAARLATGNNYAVDVGYSVKLGVQDSFMSRAVSVLDLPLSARASKDKVDLRAQAIDSRFLTLALVKEVQMQCIESESKDQFSFGNILSRVFDDGDPYRINHVKNFASAKPQIVQLFNAYVTKDHGVSVLDAHNFHSFLYHCKLLRFQSPLVQSEYVPKPVFPGLLVVFRNDPASWKFLTAQPSPDAK